MNWVSKILSAALLTFFLGTMFFSLFHMSIGINMSGGMTDCPFMAHEEVICSMNLADHIGTWKSSFLAVTSNIVILLSVVGAVVFAVTFTPYLFTLKRKLIPKLQQRLKERTYAFSYRPLQDLFSSGILHPKLF